MLEVGNIVFLDGFRIRAGCSLLVHTCFLIDNSFCYVFIIHKMNIKLVGNCKKEIYCFFYMQENISNWFIVIEYSTTVFIVNLNVHRLSVYFQYICKNIRYFPSYTLHKFSSKKQSLTLRYRKPQHTFLTVCKLLWATQA